MKKENDLYYREKQKEKHILLFNLYDYYYWLQLKMMMMIDS